MPTETRPTHHDPIGAALGDSVARAAPRPLGRSAIPIATIGAMAALVLAALTARQRGAIEALVVAIACATIAALLAAALEYRRRYRFLGALEARPRHPAARRPPPTPEPTAPAVSLDEVDRLRANVAELDAALRRLGDLTARDLRSPVRGIGSLVEFLRDDLGDDASPTVVHHLERIEKRTHDMAGAVDEILRLAKAESHHESATATDVASLVHYLVATVDLRSAIGIELDIDLPPILTTATPLASCVRNLIDNAVRHHHDPLHGHVVVSARLNGSDRLVVSVEDDGPGFDPSVVRRRIQAAGAKLRASGDGVGLQVVSRICEVHGASLRIHSEPGGGSICSLHWPVEAVLPVSTRRPSPLDVTGPVIDLRDRPARTVRPAAPTDPSVATVPGDGSASPPRVDR